MRESESGPRPLSFAGSVVAVLTGCASLTPSLLPRDWLLQGILSGLLLGIGYGAGAAIGALVRRGRPSLPRPGARTWWVTAASAVVVLSLSLWLAGGWQRELRQLTGMTDVDWRPVPVVLVAGGLGGLLLLVARLLRLLARELAGTLRRPARIVARTGLLLPPRGRFAVRTAPVLAGLLATLLAADGSGVAAVGAVELREHRAAWASSAPVELTRPNSWLRSGGPGSQVAWETLAGPGQEFVTGAVTTADLAGFAAFRGVDGPVRKPIRIYVGRDSAPDPAARAQLVVDELVRTGASDRQVVAVVVTTGTGWVNPVAAETVEYLYGGDTAVVAVQYSELPSWLSFLTERRAVAESAAATITAVRRWLDQQPAASRPQLVVYGESLGAYGTESAFGELTNLLDTVDAALLAGGPHTSPIRAQVVAEREPASPVWRPDLAADVPVRFLPDGAAGATGARVGYLQNLTDPVVWWRPSLLYQRPEWLSQPRHPDRPAAAHWLPVVTFWQVTVDLLRSTEPPDGYGHSYRASVVDGWVTVLDPPGWGDADTERLRAQVG
ncbi:alpha/beta-hydrolase family protein [Natronosporangium hydrolyticum]|uniref:Alpha/beta-hydrolase family protein n=1 Tax=Natronosporangium hydrolyticum TaxID=2811111 RepID=A0A895YK72_9ACTN|nr:alpha/beta-hydrolase family protein [Natronosporangium hydrolyticum]QSB15026.1 alpha/beta-hydrolase family protein [Natronosporangium hydrolyticum]